MEKRQELEKLKDQLNVLIKNVGGLNANLDDQKKVIELGRKIEALEQEINGKK